MYKKRLETWLEVVVGKNDPDALGLQNASGQIECQDDLVDLAAWVLRLGRRSAEHRR